MIGPFIMLALLALPAEPPAVSGHTIEACDVHLSEVGRRARFQASYIYRLSTDSAGYRAALTPVKTDLADFVELASLESCIGRWRLNPNSAYLVVFTAGTTGEMYQNWKLHIRDADNQALPALTILLPRQPYPSEES